MGFLGLCLLLGAAEAALIAGPAQAWYVRLVHPAGAIPHGFFRLAWGLVYLFSGTAAWLVWRQGPSNSAAALRLWGWSLFATAARAAAMFGARSLLGALATAIIAAVLLLAVARLFFRHYRPAGWLMVPSLLWSGYLVFLVIGLLQLNPG